MSLIITVKINLSRLIDQKKRLRQDRYIQR